MPDITWNKLTDRQQISILTAYKMEQGGGIADSRTIPGATEYLWISPNTQQLNKLPLFEVQP